MKRFDLYGACCQSIFEVKEQLEAHLNCALKLHESGYMGGEYYRSTAPPEDLKVLRHLPDDEGYHLEDGFEAWPVLVYVSNSERWAELDVALSRVPGLVHLRTELV